MKLVFLGAPGSGKGTQAAILSAALGIPAISTGDMLRRAVAAGTALGTGVAGVLSSGQLVEDATMAEVVRERLTQPDAEQGFILDGYPRTTGQANALSGILAENGWELDAVIHFVVPESELVSRALARQRADDQESVIRQRLEVYRQQTAPLIDYYEERGLLRRVDGHQSIEAVAQSVTEALGVTK